MQIGAAGLDLQGRRAERVAVDLQDRGIDQQQAADLRQRLKTFSQDWDRPEMDAYDAV